MKKIFYFFILIIGCLSMRIYAQNRALNFYGVNDFVQINTNGIFTSYTIETWVKFNGATANQNVIVS